MAIPKWKLRERIHDASKKSILRSMRDHLRKLEVMPIEYLVDRDLIGCCQTREEAIELQRRAIQEIES